MDCLAIADPTGSGTARDHLEWAAVHPRFARFSPPSIARALDAPRKRKPVS